MKAFKIEGTMQIKDGFIIDTWTNHTNTNAPSPHTVRGQIIRQSGRELAAKWEGEMQSETVMRRVK